MKILVFVLLPPSTKPTEFDQAIQKQLAPHRLDHSLDEYQPTWKFDYLCQFDSTLNCRETDEELPHDVLEEWQGYVSKASRLRPEAHASAIVTPDGSWHEIYDFGWKYPKDEQLMKNNTLAEKQWQEHCRNLLSQCHDCWVIEVWAHS